MKIRYAVALAFAIGAVGVTAVQSSGRTIQADSLRCG